MGIILGSFEGNLGSVEVIENFIFLGIEIDKTREEMKGRLALGKT